VLETAVDVAQCSFGYFNHGASCAGFELELDAEHASSCGPVEPVDEPAAGFNWHSDATTG
jgi:hypothetical protein